MSTSEKCVRAGEWDYCICDDCTAELVAMGNHSHDCECDACNAMNVSTGGIQCSDPACDKQAHAKCKACHNWYCEGQINAFNGVCEYCHTRIAEGVGYCDCCVEQEVAYSNIDGQNMCQDCYDDWCEQYTHPY